MPAKGIAAKKTTPVKLKAPAAAAVPPEPAAAVPQPDFSAVDVTAASPFSMVIPARKPSAEVKKAWSRLKKNESLGEGTFNLFTPYLLLIIEYIKDKLAEAPNYDHCEWRELSLLHQFDSDVMRSTRACVCQSLSLSLSLSPSFAVFPSRSLALALCILD